MFFGDSFAGKAAPKKISQHDQAWLTAKIALISTVLWVPVGLGMILVRPFPHNLPDTAFYTLEVAALPANTLLRCSFHISSRCCPQTVVMAGLRGCSAPAYSACEGYSVCRLAC